MLKLKIGQIVYVACATTGRKLSGYKICKVIKVGRKYFELDGFEGTKFRLDKGYEKTEYTPCLQVYLTRQEVYAEVNTRHLHKAVSEYMVGNSYAYYGQTGKVSYTQLLAIAGILGIEPIPEDEFYQQHGL